MYPKTALIAILLSAATIFGKQNEPITDDEWARLKALGISGRSPGQNQPITDDEWARLKSIGVGTRSRVEGTLVARDKELNCGTDVTGNTPIGGHGIWVPRTQFEDAADKFCRGYVGTEISVGHETSDTYAITLTNQDHPDQTGANGNLVFAIYNTERKPTYYIDHDTCLRAMKQPLLDHVSKRRGLDVIAKRDYCWGHKNNDYEGGYFYITGIGAFGSEVYKA